MGLFDFLRGGSPEDRFAQTAMKRLDRVGWPGAVGYDRERFALLLELGGEIPLAQGFGKHAAGRAGVDEIIADLFDPQPSLSFSEAVADLRPVVRQRSMVEVARLAEKTSPYHWPGAGIAVLGEIGDHLVVVAGIDRPPAVRLRLAADVAAWGVSRELLLSRALDNLGANPLRFEPAQGGFFLSACDDAYHAARMLAPDDFRKLDVKGAVVAVPMMSEWVAAAGSDDQEALLAMAEFVGNTVEKDLRGFGFGPMILEGGAWRPFEPEAPELWPVRDLWKRQRVWDYRSQDVVLQSWLDRNDPECIATATEAGWLEGRLITATPWGEECLPALLPLVDTVSMATADGEAIIRTWDDAMAAVPLRPEPGHWPPRVRVETWPDPEAWRALKARPEPPGFVDR